MNRFRINILVRVIIIVALIFIGGSFFFYTRHWLISLWFLLFVIIATLELVKYIERVKRDLYTFLISIKQNDFSGNYKKKQHSKEDEMLQQAYSLISEEFKKLRSQKETNFHFLNAVVEQSGVAMIGYPVKNEQVTLMNQAARTLFDKPFIPGLNTFDQIDPQLTRTIRQLKSNQKELVKIVINNQLLNLSVIAKELVLENESYKLITFQNIKAELDEKEMESWQKLIRVLTHEIKNSAIPISTLTEVINQMIMDEQGNLRDLQDLDAEELEDIRLGMTTVEKRSKGLVNFVNAYGKLAKVPEPKITLLSVGDLIKDIENLLHHDLKKSGIEFIIQADKNLFIKADQELIEQVLINLVKNAREALYIIENPRILLRAYKEKNQLVIAVSDNGNGIDPEIMDNIFVPFYTTKKEGSGIGLSLSRQIMRAHSGSITVSSSPQDGTTFFLKF